MGFPEECQKHFDRPPKVKEPVSDTQAYRQFGNAVIVPLVVDIAAAMVRKLKGVKAI